MSIYLRPDNLHDALDALRAHNLMIIAGGTDYFPARVATPLDDDLLDVTAISALRGIEVLSDHLHIGALTTWSDILAADLPPYLNGLKQAAGAIGGVQIQNTATVVGNICNASPAADGVPNLLALDARVALASLRGERSVALADFIIGNRNTTRASDEMVVAITIPIPATGTDSLFIKLGARSYMVISIVMMALVIEPNGDYVGSARIAVGSCAPVSRRLASVEESLLGLKLDDKLGRHVESLAGLDPIDDIRATAGYRNDAALTLLRRGLAELGERMGAGR